jgi:3-deoxy-D-manno-octulosonic acid (KDO) 8-phosphate synthase
MTCCMADDLRRVSLVPRHSRINQKTRTGFMFRRNVDKANRRNLKSIIVMHRPLLFP